MDVIQLSGYTEAEKLGIAKRYLLPKQLEAPGLKRSQLDALRHDAAHDHPRVHARGRRAQPRAAPRRHLPQGRHAGREGQDAEDAGRRRSGCASGSGRGASRGEVRKRTSAARRRDRASPTRPPAATSSSSRRLPIPGKGNLTVTGQLGEVMQESARAALSWVRSHADELGVDEDWFDEARRPHPRPAGAVPKDGPSAGVTMATAIASLVRDEPVAEDVGMTGEITLTGQVLPIGGIREKSLAAQRAGLKRVILPRENEADLVELPPETREALEFIPADTIEDVFAAAFDGKRPARSRGRAPRDRAAGREAATARRAGLQPGQARFRADCNERDLTPVAVALRADQLALGREPVVDRRSTFERRVL